ncbi:hypothetical protein WR25_13196 [Diploscapter pachys]|uniref:ATP-dependent DNA helicase n=1 Tax=Diploscapter pachys TaxID=2018661 RepID=A0A2A2KY71_9BILA|nr:hypothetical protein WR25_13196 [Diploscapter pachys]
MIWDRKGGVTGMVIKKCIGRMYSIHPKQGELFYLRMILLHKKGPRSWEELLITEDYDNDPLPKDTFKEACKAMGLLDDNIQWEAYFEEAKDYASPFQLRELFVSVITHGENVDVKEIWERFKEYFAEDYNRNYEEEVAIRRALVEIEKQLENVGDSVEKYGIPKPNMTEFENDLPWDPNEEMQKGETMRAAMNPAQESVIAYILEKLQELQDASLQNGCVFIDGPGGSGKTYTYRTLCHLLRGMGIRYKTAAWMGIAANNMPDGRTMHKTYGLPFEMDSKSSSNAKPNNKIGKELRETKVFIIDEISMVPKYAIELIDRKLRELTDVNLPFGRRIFIIGGDFRQILPIQKHAGRNELISLSVVNSELWELFQVFHLKKNERVLQDDRSNVTNRPVREDFAKWLLKLGNGELPADDEYISVPDSCITRGLPPHELKLKVNSPVILKRNLNPAAGLCNGTRLREKELDKRP